MQPKKTKCNYCEQEILREHAHVCPLCNGSFCFKHKNPESHQCKQLDEKNWDSYKYQRTQWKKKNPRVGSKEKAPIDWEQVRLAHEVKHSTKSKKWRLSYLQGLSLVLLFAIIILIVKDYLI